MYKLFALVLSLLLTPLANAACYAPNGGLETNIAYQPCIQVEGIHSMCCALNRVEVGGVADKCTQNGLCISSDGGSWRGFCTDKDWASPGCLGKDICGDSSGGTSSNSNELTQCDDGTYCCNGGNTTCCSQNLGFTLNPTLISIKKATKVSNPSSSTSSSPSTTTSLAATSSTTTSPPNQSASNTCIPSESVENAAIRYGTNATVVGVGVGVPLAAIAVIGSILSFWLGQKRGRRTHTALSSKDEAPGTGTTSGDYKPYGEAPGIKIDGGYYAPPLRDGEMPQELRGNAIPAELGSEGRK